MDILEKRLMTLLVASVVAAAIVVSAHLVAPRLIPVRPASGMFCILLGAMWACSIAAELWQGKVVLKGGREVDRRKNPIEFWVLALIYVAIVAGHVGLGVGVLLGILGKM